MFDLLELALVNCDELFCDGLKTIDAFQPLQLYVGYECLALGQSYCLSDSVEMSPAGATIRLCTTVCATHGSKLSQRNSYSLLTVFFFIYKTLVFLYETKLITELPPYSEDIVLIIVLIFL